MPRECFRYQLRNPPAAADGARSYGRGYGVRICRRAEDAVRLAFGIKLEAAMHAGHDEVEPLQHVIWIVQRALGQNIRFDAFENPKVVPIGSVQSVDVLMLLNDFLDR